VAELRAAVDSLRAWAETLLAAGSSMVSGYLRDGGPFPNRLHISMLFARYFADLYGMTRDWADLADAEIDSWNGQTKDLGMTPGGRAIAEDLMRRFPPPNQIAGDQMS
jgi:hypothetical protein